jgi:hypothetical protein
MPVKAAPAAIFNWTGVYLGAAIADRNSFASWQTTAIANHTPPLFAGPNAPIPDPTTNPASFFSSNVQGRLYSGYNWQVSPKWVTAYGQKIETAQRRQRSNIFGLGPVLHNKLAVDA